MNVVRKCYYLKGERWDVLRDVRFDVAKGEFLTLLGPSGCGKTTLLRLIAGLESGYEGRIEINGEKIVGAGRDRDVVFQESRLLGWRSVESNIAFALPTTMGRSERDRRIEHALELVGLSDSRRAWPSQLSGGMQRRVAFARAIVNVPNVLMMDEPFSGLDLRTKMSLQQHIGGIRERERLTMILVTHDIDEALYLSDRIAILTPRPATIAEEFDVPLDRPRDCTSLRYSELRTRILSRILNDGL